MKIWASLHNPHQIIRDVVVQQNGTLPEDLEGWLPCLDSICQALDIPHPVMLTKHLQDLLKFSRTVFKSPDFMETVDFHHLVLEVLPEKKK